MHPVRSSWGHIDTQLDDVLTNGLVVMRQDSTVWVLDMHKRQAANGGGRRGCNCRPVVLAEYLGALGEEHRWEGRSSSSLVKLKLTN